jgi:DNA mismatch repair protein MutL
MKARPVPQFVNEIKAQPTAGQALTPGARAVGAGEPFALQPPTLPPSNARFTFEGGIEVAANAAVAAAQFSADQRSAAAQACAQPGTAVPHNQIDLRGVVAGANGNCGGVVLGEEEDADRPLLATLKPLGQIRNSFILAVNGAGLWIIDQHVAHERVLFERVMEKLTAGRLESQRLLVPLLIELPPAAHQALVGRARDLERFGFELESFGDVTVKVSAVPALLRTEDSSNALLALADDLEGLDRGAPVEEALRRIAAMTACHAAVKANYPLTYEKMTHILDELRKTAYSTVCPHGRPVMLRLTRREIEKNFERI